MTLAGWFQILAVLALVTGCCLAAGRFHGGGLHGQAHLA